MQGIDISRWQNGIDFKKIKKECDFVILRGGATGYGAGRAKVKDTCFDKFYDLAKANNIPVGVYYYSCADSSKEGEREAKFLYEYCLKGRKFEMPIYIDVEDTHWQLHKKNGVTNAIIAFCEYLEKKGYYVGLYCSESWLGNQIDTKRVASYTKWIAKWGDKKPDCDLWQYTDSRILDKRKVDSDKCFKDFPSIIKAKGKNGFKGAEPKKETKPEKKKAEKKPEKKVIKYTVKKGDTLTAIAKKYKTTVSKIAKDNNIKNVDLIKVGEVLKIWN